MKRIALGLGIIVLLGCTTAPSHEVTAPRPVASSSRTLTRTELATWPGRSMADEIAATRGLWLSGRGQRVELWIDGAPYALAQLRYESADNIARAEWLDVADAQLRYGPRVAGPVIALTSRVR